jgi:5-hydroxyisourate hydrolase-like protein (transthyretin family)
MTVRVNKPAINVREELADLRKPTGVAGEAMLRAETPQEQFNLIGAGRRNWIINGDFQVSQRGDYTSATSLTTSATYYVDRWAAILFAGNNGTIQKVTNQTLPNGRITDSLKLVSNVASGVYALWHWVEDYKAFRGQEATLSFWYKSNCDQAFNYYTYAAQTHVTLPNTNGQWVYFTHTRRHETNATGMRIEFYPQGLALPSGAYLEFTQFQLELGKVATPFEHRSYGEELALCQRYYQIIRSGSGAPYRRFGRGHNVSTNLAEQSLYLPVEMRTFPTLATTGTPANYAVYHGAVVTTATGIPELNTASDDEVGNVITLNTFVASGLTVGQGSTLLSNNNTNCFLAFDAEL